MAHHTPTHCRAGKPSTPPVSLQQRDAAHPRLPSVGQDISCDLVVPGHPGGWFQDAHWTLKLCAPLPRIEQVAFESCGLCTSSCVLSSISSSQERGCSLCDQPFCRILQNQCWEQACTGSVQARLFSKYFRSALLNLQVPVDAEGHCA